VQTREPKAALYGALGTSFQFAIHQGF